MLNEKWENPNHKFAFSGVDNIYKHYLKSLSKKDIQNELSKNRTYTLHKETKSTKHFNPFYIYKLHQQWQSDICYLPKACVPEFRNKYLLCTIDVFSRKLFVRILERKDSETVLKAFEETHKHINKTPEVLFVDRGGEYTNKKFQNYCKMNNIKLVFAYNETKACHVERCQRTIQNILYKMLEANQTINFFPLVEKVVKLYNNRINRITGFSPNNAFLEKNSINVRNNLEKYYLKAREKTRKKARYKIGDIVRISLKKKAFNKGYLAQFTEETFKIFNVSTSMPQPRYYLSTLDGEKVKGSFYENEITLSKHETFKIEKVIKKRKRNGKLEYFVKWVGYPSSQNSWVSEKWITLFPQENG